MVPKPVRNVYYQSRKKLFTHRVGSEWSLLLPAYAIVLVLLIYFVYFSLAIAHTPSFSDVSAIIGETNTMSKLR